MGHIHPNILLTRKNISKHIKSSTKIQQIKQFQQNCKTTEKKTTELESLPSPFSQKIAELDPSPSHPHPESSDTASINGLLDHLLRRIVQGASGFIQEEERRLLQPAESRAEM